MTTPPMSSDTRGPLPCPFCSEQVETNLRFKNECGEIWTVVHSVNFGCWTKIDKSFATEAEAVASWNVRATPTYNIKDNPDER